MQQSGQVLAVFSVPPGQVDHREERGWGNGFGPVMLEFATPHPAGADFYLHVEEFVGDNGRRNIYQGQAHVFPDGHSGLGPYRLAGQRVWKVFIKNGASGPINVVMRRL